MGQHLKAFLIALFLALPASAAELPVPGSTTNLVGNCAGLWCGVTVSTGLQNSVSGGAGTLTIPLFTGSTLTANNWCQYASSIISCNVTPVTNTNQLTNGSGFIAGNQTITLSGGVTGSGTTAITTTVTQLNGNTLTNGDWCITNGTIINCTVTPVTNTNQLTNGAGFLTANQSITLSGDASGSGTTAITATLATVNSNTGTFGSATAAPQFTVNGKGLITAASTNTITPAVGSITGLGTGVGTALATAVGSAGGPVTNGGALGTPSSGTATNLTGTAASLTAGAANAINSATTTVNTNSATAPTVGQVLTATSTTAATWQNPPSTTPALALFYHWWNSVNTSIIRIENLADSILTCNQQAPCTYGPQRIGSTFALLLIDELAQRFQQYSTGFRPIVRLSNATTTVSGGDGYTLTSGSLTNSTLLGPQQSGVSLNGGSLLTLSNAGVITIAVGQPYSSVNVACVQGSGVSGYTVTINGSSVGTACGLGSGGNTAVIQNFANPVAQASQPATGSTLTLTALGATNYLYAYEAVLFCGAAQSACTSGFVVDNMGVGGASSPWFASGTKSGSTDGGMVWIKALSGQVALGILENGENDANSGSGVTSTQQNAQNQIVATDLIAKNASVLWFGPPPYNSGGSPATYAALQQGALTYCQNQGWACLNMADLFMGDQSGTLSSVFPFTAQNTGQGATPPWGVAQGMLTSSDVQHLTDCGELLVTQQFIETIFPMWLSYPVTQSCSMNPQSSGTSSAYTNATTGFTTIAGATANTGQLEFVAPVGQIFTSVCRGYMQVGTTGVVSFQLIGSAAISNINITLSYQTAANSVYSMASATALSSAMATSSITAASNLRWTLEINGVNSTTANSFAVQAHEATGTMTVPAGATCTTQLSGPQ